MRPRTPAFGATQRATTTRSAHSQSTQAGRVSGACPTTPIGMLANSMKRDAVRLRLNVPSPRTGARDAAEQSTPRIAVTKSGTPRDGGFRPAAVTHPHELCRLESFVCVLNRLQQCDEHHPAKYRFPFSIRSIWGLYPLVPVLFAYGVKLNPDLPVL